MSLFLEYHLIQNFAPSNLNRDDTGSPKDAIFGGHRRARISSQSWKRSVRQDFANLQLLPENLGVRTKKLQSLLADRLSGKGTDEEVATKIEIALAAAGLKLEENGKTQYLLFLGEQEIAAFAELVEQYWDSLVAGEAKGKKEAKAALPKEITDKAKEILNGGKAVDVALFGRMLADLPKANQDAACQVAHAISTHRAEREFDYFTAVDDKGDEDETGAGMIGQVEFNSATFYRYAVLDVNKLFENLQADRELTLSSVSAFTEAIARAIPTCKQNSFAAHNPPEFIGVSVRHGSPLNLANAFERPITSRPGKAITQQSVEHLAAYEEQLAAAYADADDKWLFLDLTSLWPQEKGDRASSLRELVQKVRDSVEHELGD